MSRYYFHIFDEYFHHDAVGVDLTDGTAALSEAIRTVAEIVRDSRQNCAMIVTDSAQTVKFKLSLRFEIEAA